MIYDFLVIGAGIAGASVSAFLAGESSMCILEAESQPGYHATGRSAALYVPGYGPPAVRLLTRASGPFFNAPPAGFADRPLLSKRSILLIATTAQQKRLVQFRQEVEAADSMTWLGPEEVGRYQPLLKEGYVSEALLDETGSDIDIASLHRGFLRQARAQGADLKTNTALMGLKRESGIWMAETSQGVIRAHTLINAAGAWADEIGQMAGAEKINLVPKRRTALLIEADDALDLTHMPMTIDVDETFYLKPESGQLLISPANEDPMPPSDVQPDEFDIALCVDRIERAFHLNIKAIKYKWAGLRSFVTDKEPVVGYSDQCEGFFWLAGQGGYGIQTSPAMGQLAAALALGRDLPEALANSEFSADMVHPSRLKRET